MRPARRLTSLRTLVSKPRIEVVPYPGKINWLSRIYCYDCKDQMIADNEYGWDCLTCGSTIRFEMIPMPEKERALWGGDKAPSHQTTWHFRSAGYYDQVS
jgi:hypothetical protein